MKPITPETIERVIERLKRNEMEAVYFSTVAEAKDEVLRRIPAGAKVGYRRIDDPQGNGDSAGPGKGRARGLRSLEGGALQGEVAGSRQKASAVRCFSDQHERPDPGREIDQRGCHREPGHFLDPGASLFVPVAASRQDPSEPERPAAEPGQPWSVDVQAIEVTKAQIAFEDRSLKTPAQVAIDDLHVTVNGLHVPLKGSWPVAAGFRLNQQGTVESKGTLQLDPLQTALTLKLAHIGLRPFQPYLDRTMQVDIRDGELEADGELVYRSRHDPEPMLQYTGQLGLNKFHVADRVSAQEFLGWTALGLSKVALEVAPTKVKICEIVWRDPAIRFVTAQDGTTNLSRAMKAR